MKFVHPKVKDGAITASSQNLKHRVTGSSEANLAEHSLHLNFQLEQNPGDIDPIKKSRKSRNQGHNERSE